MDITAFKYDELDNMKNTIETYTVEVENHLNKIKAYNLEYKDGVYGAEQIGIVKGYLNDTATQINTIVRYFEEFQKALDQVKAAYETKQANIKVDAVETAKPADADDLVSVNPME